MVGSCLRAPCPVGAAAAGDSGRAAITIAAAIAASAFAVTKAEYLLFRRVAVRHPGAAAGRGEAGDFERRGLEEAETQLNADSLALLAPGAVAGGCRDGGVVPGFASLTEEHEDILWSVAGLAESLNERSPPRPACPNFMGGTVDAIRGCQVRGQVVSAPS